jgi:response regulator RpfG family c-di-GMP phosphodiesterase
MDDDSTKKRITAFTIAIAKALGRSVQEVRTIATGAFLHDLGSASIPSPEVSAIVSAQHESYDGTGSPHGLQGEEIPLGARILRIAAAFDALVTGRRASGAISIGEARKEIERASGTLFDPKIVATFLEMPDGIWVDLIQALGHDR